MYSPLKLKIKPIHYRKFYQFKARLGGDVSESMDGQGCAILTLDLVPKNLIFA